MSQKDDILKSRTDFKFLEKSDYLAKYYWVSLMEDFWVTSDPLNSDTPSDLFD